MFPRTGYLICFIGPMFSGKSSQLLREMIKMKDINPELNICLINHAFDTRNGNKMSSHYSGHINVPDNITYISTNKIADLDIHQYNVIGIDECQFFSDLYGTVLRWVNAGHIVYCSGLVLDYRNCKFGQLLDLVPHADIVHKLKAKCVKCLEELKSKNIHIPYHNTPDAIYTRRILKDDNQILVGASDEYIPVCRYHMNTI